jgi:translocator protein
MRLSGTLVRLDVCHTRKGTGAITLPEKWLTRRLVELAFCVCTFPDSPTCNQQRTIVVAYDVGSLSVRSLRIGPLLVAIAICVLFALFGTALIGESLGNWYDALVKPWFLIPLWAFGIVGAIYYVLFATVLYRILVHVDDRKGRVTSLALTISVMFLNELWNYGFFGLESTLVGFLGIAVFLIPVTALLLTLRTYERFSAALVAVYWIWVLYDLAWTFALWRLNS